MGLKLTASKKNINLVNSNENIEFNKPQPTLVSGVYYVPQVEDGVLSWFASGAEMPEVASAVVVGPKGESGVYIGSTPGEDDRVWIEPDATQDIPYATKEEVSNAVEEAINSIVIVDEVPF